MESNRGKQRHRNIPIFIPHLGCPHLCCFCNQKTISGNRRFTANDREVIVAGAMQTVQDSLATLSAREAEHTEIAFFGGSFTAIDPHLMEDLLSLASNLKKRGKIGGIRLSTRPDCVSTETLDLLEHYGVTQIELGIQSLSEDVLEASGRGHTVQTSLDAIRRILSRPVFTLTGQMMLGLPLSDFLKEWKTATTLCREGVPCVRIYPTVVLRGTALERELREERYTPLGVEEAAFRTAYLLRLFDRKKIRVLRTGLCAEEGLTDGLCSEYNPSFGEIARGKVFRVAIEELLPQIGEIGESAVLTLTVAKGKASAAAGYRGENRVVLRQLPGVSTVKIREDTSLSGYDFLLNVCESDGRQRCFSSPVFDPSADPSSSFSHIHIT